MCFVLNANNISILFLFSIYKYLLTIGDYLLEFDLRIQFKLILTVMSNSRYWHEHSRSIIEIRCFIIILKKIIDVYSLVFNSRYLQMQVFLGNKIHKIHCLHHFSIHTKHIPRLDSMNLRYKNHQ
jgi:hypothetical protein